MNQLPLTWSDLVGRFEVEDFKYLFFWGHSAQEGSITKACLSQWYPASFQVSGINYPSTEHFMMAEKARLFNDEPIRQRILSCQSPAEAKKLGRQIANFDEQVWQQNRFKIVVTGNVAKFSQNQKLGDFLKQTQKRILVEASPRDKIWGIGMAQSNPDAENPLLWKGPNLLGFALMSARNQIAAH
ncbi:NADAR family protein [Roseibacillus persicicus]|uniref:NADAR domain-containing protein n=1 Tax=Roseibacillus persicicus TaxID=454148 RepID=A0A918WG69_9BACT|nr:NADAR family protein [Roseibacillus persicicus]GHC48462.1 hypothetical protein GCM10007100_12930 [Roseibacillus persicicus]